jgi:hypothetical protein
MPTTYRADRVRAVFCLALGGLLAAAGASGLAATDARAPAGFSCLLAAMTLGVGGCILMTRVTVSGSGVEKRAPLDGSFRACWDEVESWWVERGGADRDTLPHARFRLRGRWEAGVVHAADVSRPGFDAFLAEVRAHAGDRETANPAPQMAK